MTLVLETQITDEWRASTQRRMLELGWSASALARACGTSPAAVTYVLTRARVSMLVPRIEAALTALCGEPDRPPTAAGIAEIAALREGRDALAEDIARLEGARGAIAERLVEAYAHLAKLDIRIRELRGGQEP